jgi:hypothetical protein
MGHLKEAKPRDLMTGFQSLFAGSAPDSAPAGVWLGGSTPVPVCEGGWMLKRGEPCVSAAW